MDSPDALRASEPRPLAAARGGDAAAMEQLWRHTGASFARTCYRLLGSPQDAEDAMQESLIGAWRGLAGFQGRSSLRTWLYRITTSACLRLTRGVRAGCCRRPPGRAGPRHRLAAGADPGDGQPALACYQQDPDGHRLRLGAINVLGPRAGRIA